MDRAKQRIKEYLDTMAASDAVFAEKMKDENKSIDKCMEFICAEVEKMSDKDSVCIDDDTVYGLAVHYYDEKNVEYESVNTRVVYAGTITDEEKAAMQEEAKRKALEKLTEEQLKTFTKKSVKKEQPKEEQQQLSLF